jgi:peptidoglycan hydrolase CwlO-like protein
MEYKTDVPGIFKNPATGALINKDNKALDAYKKRKQKEQKLDMVEQDIAGLKNDMQEIKELLRGLVK